MTTYERLSELRAKEEELWRQIKALQPQINEAHNAWAREMNSFYKQVGCEVRFNENH